MSQRGKWYQFKQRLGLGVDKPEADLHIAGDLAVDGTITQDGQPIGGITLAAVGSTPNANGASYADGTLNLQPASASHPGVVTTGAQTIAGAKKFTSKIDVTSVDNLTPLIGGAFAAGYGIAFPTGDNTIFYRTGSLLGGQHRFTDVAGNSYVVIDDTGLLVDRGSLEVDTVGQGFILKSPNGTRYKIKVADDGTLSTEAA